MEGIAITYSENPDPANLLICSLDSSHIFEKPPEGAGPVVCGYYQPNRLLGQGLMVSTCPLCYQENPATDIVLDVQESQR